MSTTWPTLRHKLSSPRILRCPRAGIGIDVRNHYYGWYLWIRLGWWVFVCGKAIGGSDA
jgi:hypothetical protein